jgi:hypothetical protein
MSYEVVTLTFQLLQVHMGMSVKYLPAPATWSLN